MQNQILQYKLLDNTVDNWMMVNPTKQQVFMLPKEESQMMQSRSPYFTGSRPAGYTNDPFNETENRDSLVNSTTLPYASSFTETDYIGMGIYSIPCFIQQAYADFKVYNPVTNESDDLFSDIDEALRNVRPGVQMFKIPKLKFIETLTDAAAIEANGGVSTKPTYGPYIISISPKYVECSILDIQVKAHYAADNMADNIDDSDPANIKPKYKRRDVYECDNTNFIGTAWGFEHNTGQAGRLMGSVVEIWNAAKTELKQVKVVGENNFNLGDNTKNLEMVLHPNTFGYDSPADEIVVGDILRVFPRETYFDQILVNMAFEDPALQIDKMVQFLTNDVVRDMTNGTMEIYDQNGFAVDSVTGNFDGKVILRYQIFQQGKYEVRKKLKQ